MTARRLPQGGRIDRSKKIDFKWDGKPLQGFQGDTLASASVSYTHLTLPTKRIV